MPNTNAPVSCKECGSQVTMKWEKTTPTITNPEPPREPVAECSNGQCDTNDTGLLAPPTPL